MRSRSFLCLVILSMFTVLGCGEDSDPSGPAANPLDSVTLSTPSAPSFGKVHLVGLPPAKRVALVEAHVRLEGEDAPLLVEEDENGTFFWAPLHPVEPNHGGPIEVFVSAGEDVSPALSLEIEALPEAPGAFERVVTTLREHIDQRAQWAGSSFEELRSTDAADIDTALLPLKVAQSYVDSASPDRNDLVALVDNENGALSAEGRELLDRLFGYGPVDVVMQAQMDAFAENGLQRLPPRMGDTRKDLCLNVGPDINTAQELSDAMILSELGNISTDLNTGAGKALHGAGLVLSVGGMLPVVGPAFSAAGVAVAAWQASAGFVDGVYPSEFVSLDFDIDQTEFPEDEPGYATWSNVEVVAASTGWVADKDIANIVLTAVGGGLSAKQKLQIQGSDFLRDAAITDLNMAGGMLLEEYGGVIEFCPMQWRVDITDLPFSTAQALNRRLDVDPTVRQVRPAEVGPDVLRVAAQPVKFAGNEVSKDLPMQTQQIIVDVSPDEVFVETPGETVQLEASIQNADLPTLLWQPQEGSWGDGIGLETNGPQVRPLITPTDEKAYPFLVVVESLSRQGLRADGEPPRQDIVTIRHELPEIVVSPSVTCLTPEQQQPYSAALPNGDPIDVTWSVEPPGQGFMQGSTYIAPSAPAEGIRVVATSVDHPDVRGEATVVVRENCMCFWFATVAGAFNAEWDGSVAIWSDPGSGFGFASIDLTSGPVGESYPSITVMTVESSPSGGTGSFEVTGLLGDKNGTVYSISPQEEAGVGISHAFIESNDGVTIEGTLVGQAWRLVDYPIFEVVDFHAPFRAREATSNAGSPCSP